MIPPFHFSRIPVLHFGAGTFNLAGDIIGRMGKTVLVVTGSQSFESSGYKNVLDKNLREKSVAPFYTSIIGEPSPELVDTTVLRFKEKHIDVVCAVGGGSVIDAGKAISAMLTHDDSVLDYLEGVGTGKIHDGVKVPFIAVPTTAGTGSETTKNAVLSRIGSDGFKKSLRHDNFVPDIAIVDPELMLSCPSHITAASGLDAFCQLLESYVSTQASPLTDALAYSGLCRAYDNLIPACTTGASNCEVRAGMAYAALVSGITLANAGLGVVHGLASALGGLYDIPHGVICGTLVGVATEVTIDVLKHQNVVNEEALRKYARVGSLLSGSDCGDTDRCCDRLIVKLYEWVDILHMPLLNEYGVTESDIENITARTGNKKNPAQLERSCIRRIIEMRM